MRTLSKHSEQTGRSMVEMLGVLAIVGVLSIGGIAGYSKAMAKYKVNKTIDQVSMLITSIRTTYGNQNSYKGLDNATAVSYDLAGNDLSGGTPSTLTNVYSGTVTITAADASGEACSATFCPTFSIKYQNIERQACAAIASSDWGGSAASGLLQIVVGTKVFKWGDNTNKLPISFVDAMAACGGTDAYAAKDITWVYN